LEWDEAGETIVVRKAGKYTAADLHGAAFPDGIPERRSLNELKEGIQQQVRDKHARR
jgi:hypothetical protein